MDVKSLPHSKNYTWDQTYLDEYAKGKSLLHGDKPDEFAVWVAKYLKEKGLNQALILDAGCGEGRNSTYLGKQGFKVWGIDIASPAVEKGKKWVKTEGLTKIVNLSVGDVTKLPYEDDLFNAVYDSSTIEFIPEREKYVEEVARVLKYKGLFFIRTAILPAKHGLDPNALKRTLEKKFKILQIQRPSNDSMNIIAEREYYLLK